MSARHSRPPAFAERLLTRALGAAVYRDDIVGDLTEAYAAIAGSRSVVYARWWYRVQALRLGVRYAVKLRPHFRRGHTMDQFAVDVRYALRSLAKRPLMTMTVMLTLALGIGANAAVFGVIDALVVRPYVFPTSIARCSSPKRRRRAMRGVNRCRRRTSWTGGARRPASSITWPRCSGGM